MIVVAILVLCVSLCPVISFPVQYNGTQNRLCDENIVSIKDILSDQNITKQEYLDLSECNFATVNFRDFNEVDNLITLILDGNRSFQVTKHIPNLPDLKRLSLQNRSLTEFPWDVLKGLSKLEDLDLRGNKLNFTSDLILSYLPNLKVLNGKNATDLGPRWTSDINTQQTEPKEDAQGNRLLHVMMIIITVLLVIVVVIVGLAIAHFYHGNRTNEDKADDKHERTDFLAKDKENLHQYKKIWSVFKEPISLVKHAFHQKTLSKEEEEAQAQ